MQSRKMLQLLMSEKYIWFILAWSVGLSFGIYTGASFSGHLSSFFRNVCLSADTFIVPSAILPISIVLIAYRCAMPGLIYPILFSKAFLDGSILLGIALAFSSASWLMGFLLFFTDRIATCFLIYFSAQCLQKDNHNIDRLYVTFMVLIAAVIVVDYFCISANLAHLML